MASADRLIEVFTEAKARPAGAERDLFLSEACRNEPELKKQILSLLQAHEAAGDFLKNKQSIPPVTVLTEKPGDKIGRYKLLQKIGEGGCGVVYMAEQEEPVRRRVAFKVIKLGMDTKQVVARFEAEGQALAMMDHPNIAKVFDAGATNTGRPYFVMELVRGIKITDYCDQNNLPTEERLKLFTQVCHAIQHAHQKGIIHRDIKPSNILVTVNDGVPVPKVIDFGIAKAIEQRLTDKTVFTAFEQFIGTPAYMSPEQAEMTSLDIDTRADIYSLGVLLYELLSGNTPFDAEKLVASGVAEIRRIIREQEPPKPSTRLNTLNDADLSTVAQRRQTDPPKLMQRIRGDLDWIVMKCLEKDRTRRYETANGLAVDIQRHLSNEPVVARPPSNLYRFQKLVRRNKLAFAAGAAVITVLVAGVLVSTRMALYAHRQQVRAVNAESGTRDNLYAADVGLAQLALESGNINRARDLLRGHIPKVGDRDRRGLEWRYLWSRCKGEQLASLPVSGSGAINGVAITPDDRFIIAARGSGMLDMLRFEDFKTVFTTNAFAKTKGSCSGIAISQSGKLIAVSGNTEGEVSVWKLGSEGDLSLMWRIQATNPFGVAFAPDGRTLAVGTEASFYTGDLSAGGITKLYDLTTGGEIARLPESGGRAVAFSPDGKWLATGPWQGHDIKLWDAATHKLARTVTIRTPLWAEFSSDSQLLFSGTMFGEARCYSVLDSQPTLELPRVADTATPQGALSADGHWAAACGVSTITLEDLRTQKSIELTGHGGELRALAFTHDGELLVSGDADGSLMLWSVQGVRKGRARLYDNWPSFRSLPMPPSSPNGERLALRNENEFDTRDARHAPGHITILNGKTGAVGLTLPTSSFPLAFLDDNTLLTIWRVHYLEAFNRLRSNGAIDQKAPQLEFWNLTTLAKRSVNLEAAGTNHISAITVSPDNRLMALAWIWGEKATGVRVLEIATGELRFSASGLETRINGLAFSADGRRLAVSMQSGEVQILQPPSGEAILKLKPAGDVADCPAFSPDGKWLAVAGWKGVRVWSLPDGKEQTGLGSTVRSVRHVRFSADGNTLLAYGWGQTKLWDMRTGRELFAMPFEKPRDLFPLTGEFYACVGLVRWDIHRFVFEVFELPPLEGAEQWLKAQPATLAEVRQLIRGE